MFLDILFMERLAHVKMLDIANVLYSQGGVGSMGGEVRIYAKGR